MREAAAAAIAGIGLVLQHGDAAAPGCGNLQRSVREAGRPAAAQRGVQRGDQIAHRAAADGRGAAAIE